MPRYFEVPDDFEAPDTFKEYKPEDTSGLKNKANELLGESKAKDVTILERDATIKKLQSDLANGPKGDISKLQAQLDDATNKLSESNSKYSDLVKQNTQSKINGEAGRIAATLSKDTRRAGLLAEKIATRLSYGEDNSFTVLDGSGNPTISSIDELSGQIKQEYDFLVDGSKASGGGAQGGTGGASDTNTIKRSEWDNMEPLKQASFVDSGGIVNPD